MTQSAVGDHVLSCYFEIIICSTVNALMCQKCEPSNKVPMPRCLEMSKFGFISFRQCPENTNACYSTETGKDRFLKYCCFFCISLYFSRNDRWYGHYNIRMYLWSYRKKPVILWIKRNARTPGFRNIQISQNRILYVLWRLLQLQWNPYKSFGN